MLMKKILLIHGPNLNLLGEREPGIYGRDTMATINAEVVDKCQKNGMDCVVFQSNSEGAIIDRIHAAREDCDAILLNAGAYNPLLDRHPRRHRGPSALPVIEIHLSNVHAREELPPCIGHRAGLRGRHRRASAKTATCSPWTR